MVNADPSPDAEEVLERELGVILAAAGIRKSAGLAGRLADAIEDYVSAASASLVERVRKLEKGPAPVVAPAVRKGPASDASEPASAPVRAKVLREVAAGAPPGETAAYLSQMAKAAEAE